MPLIEKYEINRAKSVDLLSYLRANEPQELRQTAPNEYRTATHSSLVIRSDRWYWNRGGFGGRNAIDFLVKVRGLKFLDAVETVLGSRLSFVQPLGGEKGREENVASPKKYDFYPPKYRYGNKATAYLQKRGISSEVIGEALGAGVLYESRYYNPPSQYHNAAVCAFVGKNEEGKVVFAALRGIDCDLKIDKAGSDKKYNFTLPAKNPDCVNLAVFESPIDALSHAALEQRNGWDYDVHRLSLGGISSVALFSFLERNRQIKKVALCLDNDEAGLTATHKIKAEFANSEIFRHIEVSANPPANGKDYNEVLLREVTAERENKQSNRHYKTADILL